MLFRLRVEPGPEKGVPPAPTSPLPRPGKGVPIPPTPPCLPAWINLGRGYPPHPPAWTWDGGNPPSPGLGKGVTSPSGPGKGVTSPSGPGKGVTLPISRMVVPPPPKMVDKVETSPSVVLRMRAVIIQRWQRWQQRFQWGRAK